MSQATPRPALGCAAFIAAISAAESGAFKFLLETGEIAFRVRDLRGIAIFARERVTSNHRLRFEREHAVQLLCPVARLPPQSERPYAAIPARTAMPHLTQRAQTEVALYVGSAPRS